MRNFLCILLLWAGAVIAQDKTLGTANLPAGTEKRAAVIIANQDYADSRYDLQKTYNDADDMKTVLESMGFEIFTPKRDLKRTDFIRELNDLQNKLKGYSIVFFLLFWPRSRIRRPKLYDTHRCSP